MGTRDDDNEMGSEAEALAMLSPEERAAMLEDAEDDAAAAKKVAGDDDEDDKDDGKKPAAAKKDDDDGEDDDSNDDEDGEDDAAAKAAQDAADSAATSAADAAKTVDQAAQHEPIKLDLTAVDTNYNKALEAMDTAKAAEFKKLMDGEITAEDYSKFESKYLRDRDAAAAERNDAAAWYKEINAFMNDVLKSDGINYATDGKMNAAFDRWVRTLGQDPDNAHRDGSWFLKEAHAMVKLQYHIGDSKPAQSDKPGKEAEKQDKPKGRAPNTSNLPPTLGRLPAAADSEAADEGEFAHIDKLKGMDLELALRKMTPEQEERYLRG